MDTTCQIAHCHKSEDNMKFQFRSFKTALQLVHTLWECVTVNHQHVFISWWQEVVSLWGCAPEIRNVQRNNGSFFLSRINEIIIRIPEETLIRVQSAFKESVDARSCYRQSKMALFWATFNTDCPWSSVTCSSVHFFVPQKWVILQMNYRWFVLQRV